MRPARDALIWLVAIVAASALAFWLGGYATDVYRKMLIWVALALSYNFLFGIAGQVAFSHFAFAGVGAYAIVIFAHQLGLPFGLAFMLALALSAALAFVVALPSTRRSIHKVSATSSTSTTVYQGPLIATSNTRGRR